VIAVDGNTVRGAKGKGGKAPHLVAALAHGIGAVLWQVARRRSRTRSLNDAQRIRMIYVTTLGVFRYREVSSDSAALTDHDTMRTSTPAREHLEKDT
jgi:hypothetical protein